MQTGKCSNKVEQKETVLLIYASNAIQCDFSSVTVKHWRANSQRSAVDEQPEQLISCWGKQEDKDGSIITPVVISRL